MGAFNFSHLLGFEWDNGNLNKNWNKHQVSTGECEEVFFNEPFFVYYDENHSIVENRYFVLGETNDQRLLFIVFTIRKSYLRVISARDMNKTRGKFMKTLKKIPKFKNEQEESHFWSHNDSTEYIDFSKANKFNAANLKPSTKSISIRLPESLLQRLKTIANKKDIPYQSLIKVYLAEKIRDELH